MNTINPIPSTTPPQPSLLLKSNGLGFTPLGTFFRMATSAQRWGADQMFGRLEGIKNPVLACRHGPINSSIVNNLLTHFQTINSKLQFSTYMCANPIQDMTEENLKAHLTDLFAASGASPNSTWVFPVLLKTKAPWFTSVLGELEHMTVFIVQDGKLEFYDPLGVSMNVYSWSPKVQIAKAGQIIHEFMFPGIKFEPLENHNPHQSDASMCGVFLLAWIHHRVVEGKTQREWIKKLAHTHDYEIRKDVDQLLAECTSKEEPISPRVIGDSDDGEILTFDLDDDTDA